VKKKSNAKQEKSKADIVCSKCGKPTEGLHSCPYATEIGDSYDEEYCDCCLECTQNCLDDI